jgi:uncharacterized protein DUF929
MRARQKKKDRTRRITIYVTVAIIAASIAVGVYFVSTAAGGSSLDKYDGLPVSSTVMAGLQSVSRQPYGPSPTSAMQADVDKFAQSPYVSNGKPEVVFVGGEFCPYCAVERWALIMALNRFGNFTNLHYTTSANDEGDYATFTFAGSSYSSNYLVFKAYEAENRQGSALQTVPANYSSAWNTFGNGFPFLNFGNTYVIKVSLLAFPDILAGGNWTSILNGISTSDSTGLQIREAANMITSVICKITSGAPAAICSAPPISTTTSAISGPSYGPLAVAQHTTQSLTQTRTLPSGSKRFG